MAIYSKERLSSSSLTKWPFDSASNVPVYVSRLFSDAIVDLPADVTPNVYISYVKTENGIISFTVMVKGENKMYLEPVDKDGYTTIDCGPYFRVVVDNAHIWDRNIEDLGIYPIDKACIVEDNAKVRSLTIMNSVDGTSFPVVTASGITGDVAILAGRNMVVTATYPDSDTGPTGVRLEAVPGAGTGTVPCECEDENPDAGMSLKPGKENDIVIIGDGCINVSEDDSGAVIKIDGRCSACCPLEKCVDMANSLHDNAGSTGELYDDIKDEADSISDIITKHNEDALSAFEDDAVLYVTATRASSSYKTSDKAMLRNIQIRGRLTSVIVSGEVMNRSNAVDMWVTLRHNVPKMALMSKSVEVTDSNEGVIVPGELTNRFVLKPKQRAVFTLLFADEDVVEEAAPLVSGAIMAMFNWSNPNGKSYTVNRSVNFEV